MPYRKGLLAAGFTAAVLGSLAILPKPASALAYDYTNPANSCGSGAITARSAEMLAGWGYVQLRYSGACRTAWSRIVSGNAGDYPWVNRTPTPGDTSNYPKAGDVFSLQLNDAGQQATAWGRNSLGYINTGSY